MEHVEVRGHRIPKLGFGTWQLEGDEAYDGVRHALEIGYRHIDTAQAYGNEAEVGRAIADSDVDRGDVWLTTKIWRENARADDVRRSTEESLRALRTDHVDLLLLHWPVDDVPLQETLEAMQECVEDGLTRTIGVSNFTPSQLKEALDLAPIITDQVEYHPLLVQRELRDLAVDRDIVLTAYSPLAKGEVPGHDVLAEIGEAHGKTPVQVTLRWLVQQRNVATIPRSSSAEHREANFAIWDFALSDEEVERIESLDDGTRTVDPPFAPDWER